MARVFTIGFKFQDEVYKAIIALKNDNGKMTVHIRVFDEALIHILGNHSTEFAGLTGYKQLDGLNHPQAYDLLETISKAALQHLLS